MSNPVLTPAMRKEIVELTIKTYQEEMERQRMQLLPNQEQEDLLNQKETDEQTDE